MVKSFQYNPRKETEKTEDDVNTLITATSPLNSVYDDTANSLTLSVNTGNTEGKLLKIKAGETIPEGHVLVLSGTDVVGVDTGIDENSFMKVGTLANTQYLFANGHKIQGKSTADFKADAGTTNINATGGSTGIGLGDSNAFAVLHVGADNGDGEIVNEKRRRFRYSGAFQVNSNTTQTSMSIYAVSSIISGDYVMSMDGDLQSSDDRIKSEEEPIELATEKLLQVKCKNYWKHSKHRVDEDDEAPVDKDASGNVIEKIWESGVVAQEIENIEGLQHLVLTGPDMNTGGDEELKAVKYQGFISFLIKSIQELNERIVILENK